MNGQPFQRRQYQEVGELNNRHEFRSLRGQSNDFKEAADKSQAAGIADEGAAYTKAINPERDEDETSEGEALEKTQEEAAEERKEGGYQ